MIHRRHRALFVIGVVAAALIAGFLARAFLLEAALKAYLAQSGDRSPQLEVLHVGLSESTIANVKTRWLRAARVTARYGPADLLNARVALLEVDGLALDLDLTTRDPGRAFQLPSVPPIALSEAVISAKTPMGPVTINAEGRTEPVGGAELRGDLDIRGSSDFGDFDGRLSAVVGAGGVRHLVLKLDAPSLWLDGMALGKTTLDIALREARWSARVATQTADARAKFALRGSASGIKRLRDIAIEFDARIDGKAGLLRDLMPEPPDVEEIRLGLSMTTKGLPPDPLPSSPGAWVTALASLGLFGEATVDVVELHHPASRRLVSAGMGVTVAGESDGLMVTMPDKILVSAKAFPDPPADAGNPTFGWQQLLADGGVLHLHGPDKAAPLSLMVRSMSGGGVRLTYDGTARLSSTNSRQVWLRAKGEARIPPDIGPVRFQSDQTAFGLRGIAIPGLQIDSARFEGSVSGDGQSMTVRGEFDIASPDLRLGDLGLSEARLSLPIQALVADGGLKLSATKPGRLRWRQAGVQPGIVRLPDDFSLGIREVALEAHAGEIAYEARIEAEDFKLSFAAHPKPIDVELSALPLSVKGRWLRDVGQHTEVDFGFDWLELADYGIKATNLRGREVFSPGQGQERLTFSVEEVRSFRSPPPFGAFSLDAAIDHSGTDIKAEAKANTPAGRALLDIKAVHSRVNQTGSAKVSLAPSLAGPEPLALNALLPAAGDLVLSRGGVTGTAELFWSDAGIQGRARLGLAGVSLESGQVSVGNLNGDIVLDSLFPLKTAVGQRLTAARIEAGQVLRNLDMTFQVAPVDPKGDIQFQIVGASMESAFGPLALDAGTVIPERRLFDFRVRVIDLDLDALSDWASIEGLEVTGDLSGVVPLRIEGNKLSIENAALSNSVKGRIAFRSDLAARALAAGGEPVELMLRALESFEYEELKITAETREDEDTIELLVSTLGKNPNVLEGHPFQFNIRLTGNLPQLLEILSQGSEVAGSVLGRMWRLKP